MPTKQSSHLDRHAASRLAMMTVPFALTLNIQANRASSSSIVMAALVAAIRAFIDRYLLRLSARLL